MSSTTENPNTTDDQFLASNAEFFTQAFAPLNQIFQNSGSMTIISEEARNTVVLNIKKTDDDGAMDVDCALLEPHQESLSECIKSLSI